jgi:hypothetical protein
VSSRGTLPPSRDPRAPKRGAWRVRRSVNIEGVVRPVPGSGNIRSVAGSSGRSGSSLARLGRRAAGTLCALWLPTTLFRAVDDAEQRPSRQLGAGGEPGAQLLAAPLVHADLAAAAALAATHQEGAAPRVEVVLGERERLLEA